VRQIDAQELSDALTGNVEYALLDVREEGVFSAAHLLTASCVPLSRMELMIAQLVPQLHTQIVLCGDTGLAERAALKLQQMGYTAASIFPGGEEDWKSAGLGVYSGVYVPSKAFGELVEHAYGTPSLSAAELKAKLDAGEDILVVDSRPLDEYRTRNIPGAICAPGVELVYRIKDLAPSEDTLIVVNCGGRTRSIIGAQLLLNAGVPNKVLALRNGTMGWHLAGYALEQGQTRRAPPVSPLALEWARMAANRMAARFSIRSIDTKTLNDWMRDTQRTLYLFDVRQPDEYATGHLPGARPVQGGQLVQETDRYIAVRRARVVLSDDTGIRATATASWLHQMGFDVYVLKDGLRGVPLETGPWRPRALGLYDVEPAEVRAEDFLANRERSASTIVDLSSSPGYRQGHIPGSYFAIRSQMDAALRTMELEKSVIVTSEDGLLARLAAPEIARLCSSSVQALVGGNEAWRAAGGEMEKGNERWAVPPADVWLKPFDQTKGKVEDRLNQYLNWEVELLDQVKRDRTVTFRLPNHA
jgi:rhodanese-related sulfurtransferase